MLAAGQVDLQVGIAAVVLKGSAVGFPQVGVHHVDEHLVAVNEGLAVFQRVQRMAVQPVDGRVQVGVETLVLHNVIKRIYDHFTIPYSLAMASSIIF